MGNFAARNGSLCIGILLTILPALGHAQSAAVSVPLMLAPDAERQGFVRIINESDEAGTVRITAVDDAGTAANPIEIRLAANRSFHFNSDDLANGNAAKGIDRIGLPRQGHWRLAVETALEDVQVQAFVRTRAGFLTAMHDMLPRDAQGRLVARMLNPGSNSNQASKLRLVNTGENAERVSISGVDDQGSSAGPVTLTLAAGQSRTMSAFDLEEGAQGLTGRLGDGAGKWRLLVTAGQSVVGVSLLETSIGPITNISTAGVPAMAMTPTQPGNQGNSFADAFNLALDGQISGRIDPAGESDYYRIPSESGTLTVYTTGDLDTRGDLYDDDQHLIASNDDGSSSDGVNFRIVQELDADTYYAYYVRVEAYSRNVTGSYTLHTEFSASTESTGDDHGNDIRSATNLALGGQQSGRIDPVGDKDYFRIQVAQSGTLTVHTTGGTDTFGRLFNSSGTRLTTNDDGGASTNFRIEREVDAGTYYAEVTEYADNATGSYTVHAEFADSTEPEPPTTQTLFGSIKTNSSAFGDRVLRIGISWGYTDRYEASQRATQECRRGLEEGGGDWARCAALGMHFNSANYLGDEKCGAAAKGLYVGSSGNTQFVGLGGGDTLAEAQNDALRECRTSFDGDAQDCEIWVSACADGSHANSNLGAPGGMMIRLQP